MGGLRSSRLGRWLCRLMAEEQAVSATEYAIMLALIILSSMAIIQGIGEKFFNVYMSIAASLPEGY